VNTNQDNPDEAMIFLNSHSSGIYSCGREEFKLRCTVKYTTALC